MKLKYTTILVKDMDESIKFYQNFGFEIENQITDLNKIITFLKNDNDSGIELIKEEDSEYGLFGIVFEVEDIAQEVQKFRENNPNMDVKINKTSNNTLAFTTDPNGVNIILSK